MLNRPHPFHSRFQPRILLSVMCRCPTENLYVSSLQCRPVRSCPKGDSCRLCLTSIRNFSAFSFEGVLQFWTTMSSSRVTGEPCFGVRVSLRKYLMRKQYVCQFASRLDGIINGYKTNTNMHSSNLFMSDTLSAWKCACATGTHLRRPLVPT